MTSELERELAQHLHKLSVEIGPRPGGSPANHAAIAYIARAMREAGLEVEEQRFACPDWTELGTYLELDGRELPTGANAYAPPCDVTAPLVPAATIAELAQADLAGRIGVLYGDLTREPLSAKAWFLKSERDDQIINLLESKRPAALITVLGRDGLLPRLIEDAEFVIPSATVPPEVGLALLSRAGSAGRLRIQTRSEAGWSANVVGRRVGAGKIVLCAHFDTKIDTPGALDNAGGVAILLALASRLRSERALELVAFANEEYLPIGDDEYLRRMGEDGLGQVTACINFDGAGGALSANSITAIAAPEALERRVRELAAAYHGVVWAEPWPESNHSTFSFRGIPAIPFTSVGRTDIAHLRNDTVEMVSVSRLAEVVALTQEVVAAL